MITLNTVDHGMDDATLEYIVKSVPTDQLGDMLKSFGYDIEVLESETVPPTYEPLEKARVFDLIKARKGQKGSPKTKVLKRIMCHRKNGKIYYQMRLVNADDTGMDQPLDPNALQTFRAKVSRLRYNATKNLVHEAADINDMKSTPEGRAALEAINKAIGDHSPCGKLTDNLHYTNIRYCTDPTPQYGDNDKITNGCVAIAKNPNNGKDQYFYSEGYRDIAETERAARGMWLAGPNGRMLVKSLTDNDAIDQDIRDCINLMYNYGMKSGSETMQSPNQLGDIVTTGATTLCAKHVIVKNKWVTRNGEKVKVRKVFLQFHQTGEKGDNRHQQMIEVTDEALAQRLVDKKEAASDGESRIFSCTNKETCAVCKEVLDCNNEDLRHSFGYAKWKEAVEQVLGHDPFHPKRKEILDPTTGLKQKFTATRAKKLIERYIMDQMGLTSANSVQKYISTKLIKLYETKPQEAAKKKKEAERAKKAAERAKKAAERVKKSGGRKRGPSKTVSASTPSAPAVKSSADSSSSKKGKGKSKRKTSKKKPKK